MCADLDDGDQIAPALNYYQYHLKGISLLPRHDYGAYPQMPYEAIDEKEYNKQVKKLGIESLSFSLYPFWIASFEAHLLKVCLRSKCPCKQVCQFII